MAGDGGVQRGWSDLPDDLLDSVYLSCSTAYDRARFAVVCASWRAVASWHRPLPALPLLLAFTAGGERVRDAQAYSSEDGRALRVPLPSGSRKLLGSHDGGWIVAASIEFGILIVNPFSGVQVPLSTDRKVHTVHESRDIRKIVFSEDPSSRGCIAAAIIGKCTIGLCRTGCPESEWMTRGLAEHRDRYDEYLLNTLYLEDIIFCNGELCGLIRHRRQLLKFDTGLNKDGAPEVTAIHRLSTIESPLPCPRGEYYCTGHIFELHGRLAMGIEVSSHYDHQVVYFVRVFQLVDKAPHDSVWVEVTSLGDCVLFVGQGCCKAVHVSTSRGGVEKNHIYHSKQHCRDHGVFTRQFSRRLDLGSCKVYHWENEGGYPPSERITSSGYHYNTDVENCMWLLPPDF